MAEEACGVCRTVPGGRGSADNLGGAVTRPKADPALRRACDHLTNILHCAYDSRATTTAPIASRYHHPSPCIVLASCIQKW